MCYVGLVVTAWARGDGAKGRNVKAAKNVQLKYNLTLIKNKQKNKIRSQWLVVVVFVTAVVSKFISNDAGVCIEWK